MLAPATAAAATAANTGAMSKTVHPSSLSSLDAEKNRKGSKILTKITERAMSVPTTSIEYRCAWMADRSLLSFFSCFARAMRKATKSRRFHHNSSAAA